MRGISTASPSTRTNPNVIYVPNVALYRSEDGGKTISIVRGAPGGDDYHQIWIDPKNSASMVLGTDQGTTISLDRGQTWSTWYNQPTAQLYHVITDNQFPYVVYGAQQDSGSAAVLAAPIMARSLPAIGFLRASSESGYMAPDPKDSNIIYLSGTYGSVDRFDKRTGFSQDITPWPVAHIRLRDQSAEISRSLDSGPALFSRRLHNALSRNPIRDENCRRRPALGDYQSRSHRIDATAGEQAGRAATVENAKQRGYGVVFTIAPSALNRDLIWAGSDTGLIHLTRDAEKTGKTSHPKASQHGARSHSSKLRTLILPLPMRPWIAAGSTIAHLISIEPAITEPPGN